MRPLPLAVIGFSLALARAVGAVDVDPARLDEAETSVCVANARLDGAVAGLTDAQRGGSVPVEQLMNQRIDDPARRAALQRTVDGMMLRAQNSLVEGFRKDLERAQDAHRRLTGSDLNVALCRGAEIRTGHAQAAHKRRQAQQDAQLAQAVRDQEAGTQELIALQTACSDSKVLSLPPEAAARLFPAGYVDSARTRLTEFTSNYQRRNGKPFDPALCR
jgi:hypothetical protein